MAASDVVKPADFNLTAARYGSLFDLAFYTAQVPSLSGANWQTAFNHYTGVGWKQGLNPSSLFNTSAYLQANPDVAASGISPLQHYVETGMAQYRGFGEVADESGYIFDVASNVSQAQVSLIKQGLAIAQSFADEVLGGGISASLRSHITIRVEATGLGNQELGGSGGVATALSVRNDLLPRLYFDVAHPYWAQDTTGRGWTTETDILKTIVHEYAHGWQQVLGAMTIYQQPLGGWFTEGIAEYVAYSALVRVGRMSAQDAFNFEMSSARATGELAGPLVSLGTTQTPLWPGHAGFLGVDWLVTESGHGLQSLSMLAKALADGKTVNAAVETAFNIRLDDFYTQFEAWRPVILSSPATALANRPHLINLGETIIGTAGDDRLSGLSADDSVAGGPGNDDIDGGNGTNTAIYSGPESSYAITLTRGSAAISVTDKAGPDGVDTLTNIQKLGFTDQTLDLTWFIKTASLSVPQIGALTELYIASFNRAPDALGLTYWGGQLKDGMSLEAIAKSFFVQPETAAKYPASTTNESFATTVYGNVLGRTPDPEGLKYWVGQLDHGFSRDKFLIAILNGAHANPDATLDIANLNNKVAVGEHFALAKGLSNGTWGQQVMAGVTSDVATVTAANAVTDNFAAISEAAGTSALTVKILGVVS